MQQKINKNFQEIRLVKLLPGSQVEIECQVPRLRFKYNRHARPGAVQGYLIRLGLPMVASGFQGPSLKYIICTSKGS
jgi:hypothetical protein